VDANLQWLTGGPTALEDFLILRNTTMDGSDDTAFFYAQAWAFTHFLLFSQDPSYQQLLPRFLQAYKSHSGPATLELVVGDGLKNMERDFHRYLKTGRYRYVTQPPVALPPPPVPVAATPEVVEGALGRLALGTEQLDLARQHASRAIQMDPGSPIGHELLAYLAVREKSSADIAAHAEAALQAGSRDSQMYMMLGDLLPYTSGADRDRTARQRANLYENAINLNSRRAEPFEDLAAALFSLSQPTTDDAEFLSLGLRIFPGDDWIRVGAAVVDFRLGRAAEAREKMALALQPGSTLDDDQRRAAKGLLNGLLAGLAPEPEEVHEESR
jgi:tetratricopeptide (TPR) repeat protein